MIQHEEIMKILEYGVMAPSGDNSQPWRFRIRDNEIDILNIPDRDNPILNFRQSGSHIAHGGVIENILIAAPALGFTCRHSLFPDPFDHNLIARVVLEKGVPRAEPFFDAIPPRCTNRKRYKETPLSAQQRTELRSVPAEIGLAAAGEVRLIEGQKQKQLLGAATASIEQVILENRELHTLLFKDVVWSANEEREKRSGLYIDTMEFKPPQKVMFRLARQWPFMRIANKFGLPKLIVKDDTKLYASGAAIGIVLMRGNSPEDFINAGRIMQRVWLHTTAAGLALQPVTALLFAMQRIKASEANVFSAAHTKLIQENYEIVRKIFGVDAGTIAMLFRVGYADPPSARSSRRSPDILEL